MEEFSCATEHRKRQHLSDEERHEIEVRLKDGWSIYRIAKHLGRSYNTIKHEINRGLLSSQNGKAPRCNEDPGKAAYRKNRSKCCRKNRMSVASDFIRFVIKQCNGSERWSLDACVRYAKANGLFPPDKMVCTKTLYNYAAAGLLPIKNIAPNKKGGKRKGNQQ